MEATSDFIPTPELMKGSPKMMYTYFLLYRCGKYLDGMEQPKNINVDTATASLLAFCPDVNTRNKMWKAYHERKKDKDVGNDVSASILTIGDFQAYLSEVLEFTESSTGGF
jgi:hypothetical protein